MTETRRSLADLKKHIKQQQERKENNNKQYSKDIYPFWKMEAGQKARIRILRDANPNNENIFFINNLSHKISIGDKNRNIQCLSNYNEKCPICELSRAYYKQEGNDSKNGKYYYRKKSAIARILVLEDPLPPDEEGNTFVGRVVKTYFGYQLINKMLAQLMDDVEPFETDPWDVMNGNDFIIEPTKDGRYNKYDVKSRFVIKSTPIPEEYRHLVEEEVDLSTFIPANPGIDKVEKLLSAHQTGEEIDGDDEDDHGDGDDDGHVVTNHKPETVVKSFPPKTSTEKKVETEEDSSDDNSTSSSNSAIMDRIKARYKKS